MYICIGNQIVKITATLPVPACAVFAGELRQRMQHIHTLGWPRCEYVTHLFGEIAHVELVWGQDWEECIISMLNLNEIKMHAFTGAPWLV